MNNIFPFFRFPFYAYPRGYPANLYKKTSNMEENKDFRHSNHTEIREIGNPSNHNTNHVEEKKSSRYSSIGPFSIHTEGLSNKEEPLLEFCGLILYLDDLIILSILFFLYKEDVKDDMLFILLILLLIS